MNIWILRDQRFHRYSQHFKGTLLNFHSFWAQVAAYKDNTLGHALYATEQEFFCRDHFNCHELAIPRDPITS